MEEKMSQAESQQGKKACFHCLSGACPRALRRFLQKPVLLDLSYL
jgi:hypothetical protein